MISYISGRFAAIEDDKVIVDVNGVGFGIYIPGRSLYMLPPIGDEIRLYTYMNVREDAITLFGFFSPEALKVFKLLIAVGGIGPKGALNILSTLTPDDLRAAVIMNDPKAICAAPGIGRKTAEKLIIELKDKLTAETFTDAVKGAGAANPMPADSVIQNEAVEALVALGYNAAESLKAVRSVDMPDEITSGELLRAALKNLL